MFAAPPRAVSSCAAVWRSCFVYFEDGLARAMKIYGIPATIVIGRDGQVFSRTSGYVPELFVDSLSGKIKEALGK